MKAQKQCPDQERQSSRGGFSLVEVVVAMVVLTYGLLGTAGTTLYIVREVTVADMATKRSMAVRSCMERARSMHFDTVGAGVDSIGEYELAWTSSAVDARTKLVRVIATGPGLVSSSTGLAIAAAAVDTIDFRMYRP